MNPLSSLYPNTLHILWSHLSQSIMTNETRNAVQKFAFSEKLNQNTCCVLRKKSSIVSSKYQYKIIWLVWINLWRPLILTGILSYSGKRNIYISPKIFSHFFQLLWKLECWANYYYKWLSSATQKFSALFFLFWNECSKKKLFVVFILKKSTYSKLESWNERMLHHLENKNFIQNVFELLSLSFNLIQRKNAYCTQDLTYYIVFFI